MTDRALSDVRVVDISQSIAGPYATKLLADAGALVTKVEPPGGDYSRRLGPFPGDVPDPEKSGLYLHLNTSKRSVTLDVSVTSGQVVLKKMLANADVFVCGEKASTLKAWGLSYDDLKADFPELVVAQVSPFGATGPYAGYDVDLSMAEAAAAADEYNSAMYAFQGAIRRRYYSRHIFGYPNDIMACADGHVVVIPGANGFPSPLTPDTASPMALLLEDVELDKTPFFKAMGERMIGWREFEALMQPYLSTHTAMEIVMTAQALRLPFAFVPTPADLLSDEHLEERGFFEKMDTKAGPLTFAGQPFKMSGTPLRASPAPERGSANVAVLVDELGYEKGDLTILSDRGVT
jgi:crotonobetainyl-CoA:carnitine CoA-transferase CaiB-like acyl-CoA transferase